MLTKVFESIKMLAVVAMPQQADLHERERSSTSSSTSGSARAPQCARLASTHSPQRCGDVRQPPETGGAPLHELEQLAAWPSWMARTTPCGFYIRHHDFSRRFACFKLSLCLLPLCCATRTPRTPHAALALAAPAAGTPHAPGHHSPRLLNVACFHFAQFA